MSIKHINLLILGLIVAFTAIAQERKIQGTVRNSKDNLPLAGVTVTLKGSNNATQTNSAGQFEIGVPGTGQVIVFSFVGFTPFELVTNSNNNYSVNLVPSDGQMNEVVVTALGISREKKALGYAVQEVKATELETRPTNALSALSGKVAGLQVISAGGNIGGSSRILLRGINSISGNNQPLFVIDGTPIDNADFSSKTAASGSAGKDFGNMIQDINPDDIENISVLKGPSAAALYGTRAANGVIIVTTKKGKKGKGYEITLNTGIEAERITRLPARQKQYGGGFSTTFRKQVINGTEYNIPEYEVDESWGPKLDGTQVLHWYNLDPEYPELYLKTEPWAYPKKDARTFFETGLANTNNLAISGGSEKTTYRLSITNKNVKGTVPNSDLYRNSINFSATSNLGRVTVFNNISYVKNQSKGRPWSGATNRGIMLEAFQWAQVQVDYDKLANYIRPDGTQILWNRSGYQNNRAGEAAKFIDNPYWSAYQSYLEENRDRFFGNIGLVVDVNPWLKVSGKVNADLYQFQYQDRIAVYSRSQSQYQEYSNTFSEFNYELLATANKKWKEFSLTANAGTNLLNQKRSISDAITQGGLIIPEYYNLRNASSVLLESNRFEKRIFSVFASASLGWRNTVFLDGTIRNDRSSTLPAGKNSFTYPSLTSSIILSELEPLKSLSWLNFAKLRLGWAQVGNDTDPYQLQKAFEPTQSFNGLPGYKLPVSLNNLNLKPEITSSREFGFNLQALNNRIGFDFTYYDNNSRNQIINIPVSTAFGYESKIINAGKINNKGIEIVLNGTPVRTKDFEWTATLNWSKNRNKVIQLAEGVNTFQLTNTLVTLVASEGNPYGQLMGYDFVYAPDGQKVIQEDGTYKRTEQLVNLGSVLPDYLWGFQNRFRYKNFDFGFLVDGRVGGKFFSQTYKVGMYTGVLDKTAANNIRENGVVLDGVKANVQFNADGTYTVSNPVKNDTKISAQAWARGEYNGPTPQVIFDGSFIKLREVSVGYTLNLKSSIARQLRLSLYGRNLWNIHTKSKYIDPEFTNSAGNIQGIEGGNIPVPLTIGLNASVRF